MEVLKTLKIEMPKDQEVSLLGTYSFYTKEEVRWEGKVRVVGTVEKQKASLITGENIKKFSF